MKWGTVTLNGQKYEVELDNETGKFSAKDLNGDTIVRDSLKLLKETLTKISRAKPWNVPFIEFDHWYGEDKPKRGVIVGKHSGNGNLLAVFEGRDSTEQVRGREIYHGNMDMNEYRRLKKQVEAAEKVLAQFKENNRIYPDVLITAHEEGAEKTGKKKAAK